MPDDEVVLVSIDEIIATQYVQDTVTVGAPLIPVQLFKSPVTCSKCGAIQERPPYLTTSMFKQCGFVCENCRCKSCSIVLHSECQCGEFHAEPSPEDSSICLECIAIRKRVANIAPELCYSRMSDIADEEPLYCYVTRKQENENEITGE